jgi:hypothetical protein
MAVHAALQAAKIEIPRPWNSPASKFSVGASSESDDWGKRLDTRERMRQ